MYLVIGIGNPDAEYNSTRHNVGREIVRALVQDWKMEKKLFAEIAKQHDVVYALPTTYMNESGMSVAKIVANYKLKIVNLVVVHDDIDLPLGTLRISHSSGAGGHNGVQSIIDALGSKEFIRLRVGVAGVGRKRTDAATYVLKRFTKTEQSTIEETKNRAREALSIIIARGAEHAMQKYN